MTPEEAAGERFVYAGFWPRFGAIAVDVLVVGWVLSAGFGDLWAMALPDPSVIGPFHLSHVLVAALFWAYLVVATAWFGRTLGKHVFRLRVVTLDYHRPDLETVLFREVVGRIIVGATFLVGYVSAGFDPRKQGWHDKVADTYVLRRFTLLDVRDPWMETEQTSARAD